MVTKGIILAGGNGTRLFPLTKYVSKQLLPLYDKPLIYYPLSILMLSKIKDILIISKSEDKPFFKKILSDGQHLGLKISYEIQDTPSGLTEAFVIGEKFINKKRVMLILGDNFFYGQGLESIISEAIKSKKNTIFAYKVKDPKSYGVVKFNKFGKIEKIFEKPKKFISNYAIPGIYIYDKSVSSYAKTLKKSKRGETEIKDLNNIYLNKNLLDAKIFGRGVAWLDAGTPEKLLEAGEFVKVIENRQGFKIACLEEIALRNKWITKNKLSKSLSKIPECEYKDYLRSLINEKNSSHQKK
jgi:glucose-1-phosphate thymidylyltransferase